ncbi:MAG: hypothetical protein U5N86_00770 [Planctomycetota bacterium]|nr:hypothetical protein [Planctomycetota bacterium]
MYELELGQRPIIGPSQRKITVDSIDGFPPDQGVLCVVKGNRYEFIKYNGTEDSPFPAFTDCERGFAIECDDGPIFDSDPMELTARNDSGMGGIGGFGDRLYFMSMFVSSNDNFPQAGYLLLDDGADQEVVCYVGKGNLEAQEVFWLHPFRGSPIGRAYMGTTSERAWDPGTPVVQVFRTEDNHQAELQPGPTGEPLRLTVINDEQQKEEKTVRFSFNHWIAFESATSNTYAVGSARIRTCAHVSLQRTADRPAGHL